VGTSNFSKQLKELTANFLSNSGDILEKPKSFAGRPMLIIEERRIKFLRAFIDLLLHTKFISPESKYYLQDLYITQAGVAIKFNTTEKNVQAKVWYDMKKIKSIFGYKIIVDIECYRNIDLAGYEDILTETMTKYADGRDIFDRIALKMPAAKVQYSISEDEFNDFISIVVPYSLEQMKIISQELPTEPVGYIKYIMSSTLLSAEDHQRKERLLLLFKGEYSIDSEQGTSEI